MIFNKVQMYATHIVIVMEVGVDARVLAQMQLKVKASPLVNKPLTVNKIHYICWQ
jgi:hypothetical protein